MGERYLVQLAIVGLLLVCMGYEDDDSTFVRRAAAASAVNASSSSSSNSSSSSTSAGSFPALFVFGDSLADVGNNNYITTVARANSLPFGIDFPAGPTGRFCNGKIVADFIAETISLPFPPPYLAPTTKGNALLQGVSYASAAAGILRSTGYNFVGRVYLDTQLTWFGNNIKELQQLIGALATQDLLAKSLYFVIMGANDYVNNYLLKVSPTAPKYTPQQYQQVLIDEFTTQLTKLYQMGARIVLVSSIGPIGCIPSQLATRSVNGECSTFVNNLAINFNQALQDLLPKLNTQLAGANFIYADAFNPVSRFSNNPTQYGFKFGAKACCGGGRFNGEELCLPTLKPCPDRPDYVWWDAFHPTETVNKPVASLFFQTLSSTLQ